MNSLRRDAKSFDYILFALVIALAAFGVLMIGSTTGLGRGNVSPLFINQLVFALVGVGILLVMAFVNYEFIAKFFIPIYIVNIALLIVALLMPDTRGVARWIGVNIGGFEFGIQPSEFTKIFMIIFLAKIIDRYRDRINNILVVGLVLGTTAVPVALIILQRSLSASVVTVVIMLVMLYCGKIGYRYIAIGTLVVIPALVFFYVDIHAESPFLLEIGLMQEFQFDRIWNFLYPQGGDATLQNERGLAALSSGLLTGRGLFQNPVVVLEPTNDFIFSVIGAEFGFIGSVAVIFVVLVIVLRCLLIASRSEVFLGRLIATAVAIVIAFQSFTHVAINAWLLPNTGMNFPFISSGGSSMWVFMAMIGLVLNVGMTREYSMFDDMGKTYITDKK
ncbi:MAG: FtsW/RodA/SpoVE family cell cycle protein [Defluviitaleaceae bacterium]|nr:FtsW/RodA/SpoVE family cell cycle protein [Defluviitaleaceae bacterium]